MYVLGTCAFLIRGFILFLPCERLNGAHDAGDFSLLYYLLILVVTFKRFSGAHCAGDFSLLYYLLGYYTI